MKSLIPALWLLVGSYSSIQSTTVNAEDTILAAETLLQRSLDAMGGEIALKTLRGVSYRTPSIYRTQTIMQNYNLIKSDQFVATSGEQNISFSFTSSNLMQRIDRTFAVSDYWIWAAPSLPLMDYSLVVNGGDDGFACFVRGNNLIYMPTNYVQGYTDAALAEYLVSQGNKISPKLLAEIKLNNASVSSMVKLREGIALPAVHDETLNLTVIFDPATYLPYILRSYEDHPIFGPCTSDLQVSNYTSINGIMFPQRFQSIYNTPVGSDAVLEDFLVEDIELNPNFLPDFFSGLLENSTDSTREVPAGSSEFSHAEISEGFSNMLWGPGFVLTNPNVTASHPIENVSQIWNLIFDDSEYAQLVMEFEDGVIVADAPPHQSLFTIDWVQKTLKKPITHLWPSHHHRDHTGGAADFVRVGAKLIVPEMSVDYWSGIPNASLVTYTDKKPFVHRDRNIQAYFNWRPEAVHAADWAYAMVTTACPDENSGVVVFNADAWSPGTNATRFDQGFARQWLDQVVDDGLTRNAILVPAHGVPTPLIELIGITGYMYPNLTTLDWKKGALKCH